MRIETCWFCSSKVYPGHGIQFVRNDAKIFKFCRAKCHKNFKMKRNPRKVRWIKSYRKLHGKDLIQDSNLEFERKRNRPERYDRNVVGNSLKAIKPISKVGADRSYSHIRKRMTGNKRREQDRSWIEFQQSRHDLVKAPAAQKEEPSLTLPKITVKTSQTQEDHMMEE